MTLEGYTVVKTSTLVDDGRMIEIYPFRWAARRRQEQLDAQRHELSAYRWEIEAVKIDKLAVNHREIYDSIPWWIKKVFDDVWAVVPYQNVLVKEDKT